MPREISYSSPYRTGGAPAGETITIFVRYDVGEFPEGLDSGDFAFYDSNGGRTANGILLPSYPDSVTADRLNNTYLLTYTTPSISGRIWFGRELEIYYRPPPARLEFHADKAFIVNDETIQVTVYFNYIAETTTLSSPSDIIVDEGTVSNLSGGRLIYTFDLTAPETGAGVIEMNVNGIEIIKRYFAYAPPPDEDLFIPAMKYPPPHLPAGDETLYVTEVMEGEREDKNDFTVLVGFEKNVNGLSEFAVTVEAVDDNGVAQPTSLQGFEGKHSVYELTARPPSVGGTGTIIINIAADAVEGGNAPKAFAVEYSDEISIPDWQTLFTTAETYCDIVSVSPDGIQLLHQSQIDYFDYEGIIDTEKVVALSEASDIVRVVKYDVDKYIGLSNATDATAHLFVEGAETWVSEGVFKRDTYNISDWAWTRDRRLIAIATPPDAPDFGILPTREVHQAIREGYDLGGVEFSDFSLDNGEIETFENWKGMVSIAHGDSKLFMATNETGTDVQNYIFVYDADNNLISGERIPIMGKAKSLFVSDGYLYRYDDTNTTKALMRFPLDALKKPEARKSIYPQLLRPGESIDLSQFIKHAEQIVFDVGFDKPEWLSIKEKVLTVAVDAMPNSTAYVRLRGINYVGDTEKDTFGFYIYVRDVQRPQWRRF